VMGKAARRRICSHFDIEAKADEWEALYSRLIGASDHPEAESVRARVIPGI